MADQAKLDGDEAFKKKDFAEAIEHYTTAIEQNAVNGSLAKHVLLSNRSACYCSLKKYDKALEDARACTAANPAFAKGWSRKGAAMQGLGDLDGAAQAYRKALEKDPNSACKADLERIDALLSKGGASKPSASNQWSGWGSTSTSTSTSSTGGASSSRPSASGGIYSMPPSGGSSSSQIKGKMLMQAAILVIQVAAITFSIGFVLTSQDRAVGRHWFNRAAVAGTSGFLLHAVAVHGLPNFGTLMGMYRALRGTAAASEINGIRNVAMDLNTHNAFYCTLLMSSSPSILLLVPIALHSLTSIGSKGTLLAAKVPAIGAIARPILSQITSRTADITRFSAQTEVGIFVVLVMQLVTSQRNLILIILYAQLLRVRFLVSSDSRLAWDNVAARTDAVFLNARCPGIIQTGYNKVRGWVHNMGHPTPPA